MSEHDKIIEVIARALVTADNTITGYHEVHLDIKRPAAETILAALNAAGWRVVPYEPTAKMCAAAAGAMNRRENPAVWVSNKEKHGLRYKAMLDAASLPRPAERPKTQFDASWEDGE